MYADIMEPCNVLARVLDLVDTWQKDSPFTKSLNRVMSDSLFKSSSPCRTNRSSSNTAIECSPICNQYKNNVNQNLCNSFINNAHVVNNQTPRRHDA